MLGDAPASELEADRQDAMLGYYLVEGGREEDGRARLLGTLEALVEAGYERAARQIRGWLEASTGEDPGDTVRRTPPPPPIDAHEAAPPSSELPLDDLLDADELEEVALEPTPEPSPTERATIGDIQWYVDYDVALEAARNEDKAIWAHFGQNPGVAGNQAFASGPLKDSRVVEASQAFVPLFIDTFDRTKPYALYGEQFASYPVLRVFDHEGKDIAGRLDSTRTRGKIPVEDILGQFERGLAAWRER